MIAWPVLNIPKYARPQAIIPIGYPAGEPNKPAKFSLVDLVFLDNWGGKIVNVDLVMDYWSEVIRNKIIEAKETLENEGKSFGSEFLKKSKEKLNKLTKKPKK